MSNPQQPAGTERRLRTSRLMIAVLILAALGVAGYFLTRPAQTPAIPLAEAAKDVAALFETIQGNVKTRDVGGLEWKTAETKVPLRKSDLVRTYPSSSAEIKFFDETRVTVRPDSLITIEETSRGPNTGRVAWKVSSGEINYETTQRGSGSTEAVTPTFRLALESNSAGTMRVSESGLTAVAQLAGGANLETKSGEKIHLGANEGIRVDATGKAGAKQALPDKPVAQNPGGATGVVSLGPGAALALSWSPSRGATAYRVQLELKIAGGFETSLDRDGVKGTTASAPSLAAGDYTFRVAAQTGDGVQGRFSDAVSFRLERAAIPRGVATPAARSATAPALVIDVFEARSNVVRLAGKTEPGARLTVNGDAVSVQPDGSFQEFVTLARKQGEQRVVIRAISTSGGVAEVTRTLTSGQ
ncbi:MAG: fibronectin type III domain-containing protein [Vicinamibacteria bacterium]